MGTYMIKCKRMEGTSVTEVSQIGVQTRDRSLALATEKSQEKQRRTVTGDFQISNHELRNKILVTRPKDKVSPKNKANSSGISTESCRKTEDMSSSPLYRNREGGLVEIRENLLESNGNFLKNSLNSQYRDRRGSKNQGSISILRTKLTSQRFPSEEEIEEFFSAAEKDSQKRFRERYNFDVLEDIPLAGRYEWVTI